MFELMKGLSDILRYRRHERGSIDFDFPESKIILDEKGRPVDVYPQVRNAATKIIEDFMLCANETIAEEFYWREIPFCIESMRFQTMRRLISYRYFTKLWNLLKEQS